MSESVWQDQQCLKCGVVKKQKPDVYKMRIDQRTGRIVYADVCIKCERERKGYAHQAIRNRLHAEAIKERKQHGQSYEELLEEMERIHGPSSKWAPMLHIELSGKLYRQGNVTRYLNEPAVLPPNEKITLAVDYGSPMFRPSRKALEQLLGER